VNPAVIGVIAVALLEMVPVAMPDPPRAALAVVTVLVMLRWSISPPLLIFTGAVLGLALEVADGAVRKMSVVPDANGRDQ
jgi:chromate transport protein ChrA